MTEENNSLNVRRLVGAILLALGGVNTFIASQSISGLEALSPATGEFKAFLIFFSVWAIGIAIWYFVTLTKPTHKTAELIVKILFYLIIGSNTIFAFTTDASDAGIFGIILLIVYTCACPWGKRGYKKHPYADYKERK